MSPIPGWGGTGPAEAADPWWFELVADPTLPELLRRFNQAGVLAPADIHVATRLARLAGEADEQVLLAAALAVRGPRVGHVSVDLRRLRESVVVGEDEVDLEELPWPSPDGWIDRIARSPLVGTDAAPEWPGHPFRLVGCDLYLDRYWNDEVALAGDLAERAAADDRAWPSERPLSGADRAELDRLFPGPASADQRGAAEVALRRRLTVLAGGPGTGKTTTVARLLALLAGRRPHPAGRLPLMALAAPTGKAAARMEAAVRGEAARLEVPAEIRDALLRLEGTTLHRLLGTRPDRSGRFRHHRHHLLPHDIVVVDEASMVSLSMMTRLVEAVRSDAHLILVGDPEQLVSVEAGAVLADIVGATGDSPGRPSGDSPGRHSGDSPGRPSASADPTPGPRPQAGKGGRGPLSEAVFVLRTNHRFSGSLARLADAVRRGDAAATLDLLGSGDPAVEWVDTEPADLVGRPAARLPATGSLAQVATGIVDWAEAIRVASEAGDASGALAALRHHRVLCAHRRGPSGAATWNSLVEAWLAGADGNRPPSAWYAGRPVLVTANDYRLRLFNGDTGVVVAGPGGVGAGGTLPGPEAPGGHRVVFETGGAEGTGGAVPGRSVSPFLLDAVETVFAMTVHKSQGSEFDRVTLVLPPASSRLLTRQLLYTALTRARRSAVLIGTAVAVAEAVERPIARASGLGRMLWPDTIGS